MHANPGDALILQVIPRIWNDRRGAFRDCARLIKRLVTSCGIEFRHKKTSQLLYAGMGSALELCILDSAQSRALEEHGTAIPFSPFKAEYIKDLNKIKAEIYKAQDSGYDAIPLCPAGFRAMLAPWLHQAETMCHPDAMNIVPDGEPFAHLEPPWSAYYPDPNAMVIPMTTRGDLKHARIKPLETATSKFLNIDESFRGDIFEHLLKATITLNGVKQGKFKDRLSADELLPFAQERESRVLEAMHDEMFGEDNRPDPEEIKVRYSKRMGKKIKEDCGILANFVRLVKVFHQKSRNVVQKAGHGVKSVSHGMKKAGHGIKYSLRNLKIKDRKARARASEPVVTEAMDTEPTTEPVITPLTTLPRHEFVHTLADTFFKINACMSAEHNNAILSPEKLQQMAEWLEATMLEHLKAEFGDQWISIEQSYNEYVAAGDQLLANVLTPEGYFTAIRGFLAIGT